MDFSKMKEVITSNPLTGSLNASPKGLKTLNYSPKQLNKLLSSSKLKDVSPSAKDMSDSGAESEESVVLGFSVKPEVRDASNEIRPLNDSKAIQTEELKPKVKSRKTKATKDSGTQKSKTKSKKCCGLFIF